MRVLIIEDSADVAETISLCLEMRWPDTVVAVTENGEKGVEVVKSETFDLIILDINLPDIDGFEVLRRLRQLSNVPVIIVTVRGEEEDNAKGLEMGADDYIVKPFSPRDLLSRINAVVRRSRTTLTEGDPQIVQGNLKLNLATNEACLLDKTFKLTPTECKLLYTLMRSPGRTVQNEELLQNVWGDEDTENDVLRTYIRRIRDKFNDNPPRIILTEHGQGYRFISP
jgi:DNA-binding response OmpR family regulator